MMHPMVKKSVPLALSVALLASTSPLPFVIAAESTATVTPAVPVFSVPSLGKVSLGGTSYIELTGVQQLGQTVRFTLSLYNGGTTDLQFIDYWVKIRSAAGNQFSPRLIQKDADKNRIAPKSTETFTFYTNVNESTRLTDLAFDILRWDFSAPSYQRTLGTFRVPATYQPMTPAGSSLSTSINGVAVKAYVKRVNVSRTSDEYVANLTLELENTGSKSFVIPAYELAIVTSEGLTYPLEVSDLEPNTSLHPRFKKEIKLKGELPLSISDKGWKLVLAEKEGEAVSLPFASFVLPPSTAEETVGSDSVSVGEVAKFTVSDQPIEVEVSRVVRNENDTSYLAAITFALENKGTKPVAMPKYTFQLQTSTGLTYPVTADLGTDSLDPLMRKEFVLRATVPSAAGNAGWRLVLNEPADSSDPNGDVTELALFDLPADSPASPALGQGSTYSYSNEVGTYGITFESVQRVPWEDEDILSAQLKISNSSDESLPIPEIAGYFMLDDNIRVEATMIQKDKLLAVKPDDSIIIQLYGKIPYTYDYSELQIILQEKTSDEEEIHIVDFVHEGGETTSLPVIPVGQKHKIEGVGRSSEISVRSVRTYDGAEYNLFTTLVDLKNLERRFTNVASLVAHFETKDGLMFPAELAEVNGKIAPMGTVTILASTVLPNSVSFQSVKLIIGEAVQNGNLAETNNADAYINAVSFNLPLEPAAKPTFENLTLFPYTVSLSNIRTQVTSTESFALTFNYMLSKNALVTPTGSEHTFILEFIDNVGAVSFTKTFTLDQGAASETNLERGTHNYTVEIQDPVLLQKVQYLNTFKVRVYDQYEGIKKLLAESDINWF